MLKYCSIKDKLLNKINVSSRGEEPWKSFSPFSTQFIIEHPIVSSIKCKSVEQLWQGCKCNIEPGVPDYDVLNGIKPWKKGTPVKYGIFISDGYSTTDVGLGRRMIYIPAYINFVNKVLQNNNVYNKCKETVKSNITYYMYDFDYSISLDNPKPLSHAMILTDYLNIYFK